MIAYWLFCIFVVLTLVVKELYSIRKELERYNKKEE